ncbi:MAG: endo-1,4-beta-xylanase [Chloroflexi bacterium]|nr:endo-1,4-beta-xylanase [Chloroflexota bacterium]
MLTNSRKKRRRLLRVQAPRITTRASNRSRFLKRQITQFTLEKRQRLLKSRFARFGLASLALLAAFLGACSQTGAEAASPTINPATPDSLTPTPSPENPTPSVPTIEVDGLQLPDPKISNPELFDVTKQDSPIVEFANAFGVTPDQVGELTPEVKTAVDGSQFAVLTTSDLSQTADFDESGTPLMIAQQGENGEWGWSEATLSEIALAKYGIHVGTPLRHKLPDNSLYPQEVIDTIELQFNLAVIDRASWPLTQRGEIRDKTSLYFSDVDPDINSAKQANMEIVMPIFYGKSDFDWVEVLKNNPTPEQLKQLMTDRINQLIAKYGNDVSYWIVTNEAASEPNKDGYYQILGDEYPLFAFQAVRDALKNDGDTGILIYNHDEEFSLSSSNLNKREKAQQFISTLAQQGNIDAIGLQGHLFIDQNNVDFWLDKNNIKAVIDSYYETGSNNLPIFITELDVNIKNLKGNDRFLIQAAIYKNFIEACLESGKVQQITFWEPVGDDFSWLEMANSEDGWYSKNADPTLYNIDENGNILPKPSYYAILQSFLH